MARKPVENPYRTTPDAQVALKIDLASLTGAQKTTWEHQERYLEGLAEYGTVTAASRHASLSRQAQFEWKRDDKFAFKAREADARASIADEVFSIGLSHIRALKPGQNPLLIVVYNNALNPELFKPALIMSEDTAKEVLKTLGTRRANRKGEGSITEEPQTREPTPIEAMRAKAKG